MAPVPPEVLESVERLANERIAAGEPVQAQVLPLAKAREAGAMMLFGEKIPDSRADGLDGDFSRGVVWWHSPGQHAPCFCDWTSRPKRCRPQDSPHRSPHRAQSGGTCSTDARSATAGRGKPAVAIPGVPAAVRQLAEWIRDLKKQAVGDRPSITPAGRSAANGDRAEPASYPEMKATLRDAARLLNVSPFDVPAASRPC